jgi:hypothetical protein
MTQVAGDRASTVILPLPMDLLGQMMDKGRAPEGNTDNARS